MVVAGFIYEAIVELNITMTEIDEILGSETGLPAATVAKLTKIKNTIEEVETGLTHC